MQASSAVEYVSYEYVCSVVLAKSIPQWLHFYIWIHWWKDYCGDIFTDCLHSF